MSWAVMAEVESFVKNRSKTCAPVVGSVAFQVAYGHVIRDVWDTGRL